MALYKFRIIIIIIYISFDVFMLVRDADNVYSPHVVMNDDPFTAATAIHVDGKAVFTCKNSLDAFMLLVAVYNVLWLQYPSKACSCCKYMEAVIYGFTSDKLPATLARMMERVH